MIALAECRYGLFAYFTADQWLGRSLRELGEWSESEIRLWKQFLRPNMRVLDIGANIGAHSVALARIVGPNGSVIAFEPQQAVYEVAVANKILNRMWHVDLHRLAVGALDGTAWYHRPDYATDVNPGAVALTEDWSTDLEDVGVSVRMLDHMDLGRVDFIKIDVEGMEREVIEGAVELLRRERPILYIENDRADRSVALIARLEDLGYTPRWHLAPLDNRDNLRGRKEAVFPGVVSSGLLCAPPGAQLLIPGTLAMEDVELGADGTVRLLTR